MKNVQKAVKSIEKKKFLPAILIKTSINVTGCKPTFDKKIYLVRHVDGSKMTKLRES